MGPHVFGFIAKPGQKLLTDQARNTGEAAHGVLWPGKMPWFGHFPNHHPSRVGSFEIDTGKDWQSMA